MPKITKIAKQQRRDDWCSIFVDEKYSFSLPLTVVADEKLSVGKELTGQDLDKLKKQSDFSKYYDGALQKLARRAHSRREVSDYLYKKGASKQDIEKILGKLDDYGYLDDLAFAQLWARDRRSQKMRSTRQIQAELFKKGVDKSIIDQVLSEEDEDQELIALREMVAKKQKLTRYQDQQKLISYLARQGFNYDKIKLVLTEQSD